MGSLLVVLLLGIGLTGLALLLMPATRSAGRQLARVGFVGAGVLIGSFVVVSLVTLPFD